MTQRQAFWDIVNLLGLSNVRGVGSEGSFYKRDIEAIAEAVGIAYQGERTATWIAIIEHLGGVADLEADVSSGGTIENHGLEKVRALLLDGAALADDAYIPTVPVVAAALEGAGAYDPAEAVDERTFTVRAIATRQGQPAFRRTLLEVYGGQCAVTGCVQREVLEAAHIDGHKGPQSNHVTNGLLLRADVHTLFDTGLLAVDTARMSVLVSETVYEPEYVQLAGVPLLLPEDPALHPSQSALDAHRTAFWFYAS